MNMNDKNIRPVEYKFRKGETVVSTEDCPYASKGGKFRVVRNIDDNLMELFITEHPDKSFIGKMFKARPMYFKSQNEVSEKVSFSDRMKIARASKDKGEN